MIRPLILLLDIIYFNVYRLTGSYGGSIAILSLIVSLITTPFYAGASRIQSETESSGRAVQKWKEHIKKSFHGDEQVMMLHTLYRKYGYGFKAMLLPILPLLFEIPFFIAAYRLLSGMEILQGKAFLFINDLSKPDGAFYGINILPVAMTFINLSSLPTCPKNSRKTLGITALVFLMILYNSPSALTLYWTCNNLYALIKNTIFYITGKKKGEKRATARASSYTNTVFTMSSACIVMLLGFTLPLWYVSLDIACMLKFFQSYDLLVRMAPVAVYPAALTAYMALMYAVAGQKVKSAMAAGAMAICPCLIIDIILFIHQNECPHPAILNAVLILTAATVCLIAYRSRAAVTILSCLLLATGIYTAFIGHKVATEAQRVETYMGYAATSPHISLSADRKNVMVIVLDRAVGYLLPYIMEEKPELKEIYDGFTYYPKALSFGTHTNIGMPPVYGGYEYTPKKIEEDEKRLAYEKNDMALKMMPGAFIRDGYDAVLINPPYAGGEDIPDCNIFDGMLGVKAYCTDMAADPTQYLKDYAPQLFTTILTAAMPEGINSFIYSDGVMACSDSIWLLNEDRQNRNASKSMYLDSDFIKAEQELQSLPDITDTNSEGKGTLAVIYNDMPHTQPLLQEPEYTPADRVDNTAYDREHPVRRCVGHPVLKLDNEATVRAYHSNMRAITEIGRYLTYLKDIGIYDSTRIIIVSDHGFPLGAFPDMAHSGFGDTGAFSCLLMKKDFGKHGVLASNERPVTNADVPYMAMKGIVSRMEDPATGDRIRNYYAVSENELRYADTPYIWPSKTLYSYPCTYYKVDGDARNGAHWKKQNDSAV